MARKRKPIKQTKRLEVTGPDGWTHIIKGLRSVHINNQTLRLANQPPEIPQNQTLKDLAKTHAKYRTQWLSSPCYEMIRRLFMEDVIPGLTSLEKKGEGKIDRVVMLGLGSLSNGQRSSWWEFVFLESVLALLFPSFSSFSSSSGVSSDPNDTPSTDEPGSTTAVDDHTTTPTIPDPPPTPIPIYIQDPIFNPLDITYLTSLNFKILTHPAAFSEITPSTFLFAPHLEMELYAQALEAAEQIGPLLCIGTDVNECIDQLLMTLREKDGDEDAERRRQEGVFREYKDAVDGKRLPEFERDDWMGFTNVYWRKGIGENDLKN